jgi:hypothetical protein
MPKAVASCVLLALSLLAALPSLSRAQDLKAVTTSAPETEEEKQEHASRRQCALALCSTLHNHKPDTGDVTCNVQKTWRKEVLVKILSKGKVTWPWGYARCITDLKFDRAMLIKSMTLPEFEAQFDTHNIRCELEGEKEKYEVKLQIQPKVTFKQGKAVKASLNWGKIEAPTLAKTALWSADGGRQFLRRAAEYGRRGHQRIHSHQVHGGKGGVAGQVALLPRPWRGPGRALEERCARGRWWPRGAAVGRRIP